jgi:hypothetical protein
MSSHKTRQDNTRHDKTRQENTRHENEIEGRHTSKEQTF